MADSILEGYPDDPINGRIPKNDRWGVWLVKLARLLNRHSSFSGSVTLALGTKTVTFDHTEPDASYQIALSCSANETLRWASKTATSFVINSSNAASVTPADWTITRTR